MSSLVALMGFAAAPSGAAETIRITVDKVTFTPTQISAQVGDTIEWANTDFVAHTATARTKEWDVAIPANGTGSVTLNSPADFEYYCRFHPNMVGRISVTTK